MKQFPPGMMSEYRRAPSPWALLYCASPVLRFQQTGSKTLNQQKITTHPIATLTFFQRSGTEPTIFQGRPLI